MKNLIEKFGKKKVIAIGIAIALALSSGIAIPLALLNGDCDHTYDNACDVICNECGEERTITHTPNADDGDCTTPVTCTECTTVLTAAKSHDYTGDFESNETQHWHVCQNEGCNVTDEKINHIPNQENATEAAPKKCVDCHYIIEEQLSHSHVWDEVTYEWNADNTECSATRTCTKNNEHVETETVEVTSEITKQPNCTEKGETTYTAAFTNTAFVTQIKTLDNVATNDEHIWDKINYQWNADNTECTATRTCTKNSEHVETETSTAARESTGDCSTGTTTTYTATFTNTVFTTQIKTETLSVDELEHTYGDPTVEWNMDYTDCTVTRVCSTGNHTDDTLTKKLETKSDGAKTVTVYDNEKKIALFVYKQKTSSDGYYLYQSEIERANGIQVKIYNEAGNCTSEGFRLIFEGYAPDSDDSEFGEP